MAMTTVFSYLPKLVKSFGASEVQAGNNAGLIASSLFFSRIFSSIFWGYISDKFGKKKMLLISSTCVAISTFAFGFSNSFTWALVSRLLQGASMGIVLITKCILVDLCDDTNMSLAFSILFSGFHLGLVIGPSLSAVLVFPVEQYPSAFSKGSFFAEYTIFLPNLVITIGFLFGIVWGYCTIPADRSTPDPAMVSLFNKDVLKKKKRNGKVEEEELNWIRDQQDHLTKLFPNADNQIISEKSSLLSQHKYIDFFFRKQVYMLKYSSFGKILRTKEGLVAVNLFGVFGLVAVGFSEIIPLFLATSKKFGGIAMTVFEIGILILIYSVILIIAQIFTSKLQFWFSAKKTFMACVLIFACLTPLIPLSALLKEGVAQWIFLVIVLASINTVINACYVCVSIFLSNSVEANLGGAVNGLGECISSIGRALGPTLYGIFFSWSLSNIEHHRLGYPFNQYFVFFLISACCFLNLAYVYWLIPTSLNEKRESININK